MKKQGESGLDFIIDKLTNSIENATSRDSFSTDIVLVTKADLKSFVKKNGWLFNWKNEYNQPERSVYKLSIVDNPTIIQGLVSLEIRSDHVYLHLIESSAFNRGKNKTYIGVPGNLVAFACRLSAEHGFDGEISFIAKTQLIEHYEKTLGALHFGGRRMVILKTAAQKLINRYFNNQ